MSASAQQTPVGQRTRLPTGRAPGQGGGRASLTIGVDVGGTKVAAGVVDEAGTILASTRHETPADDRARTQDVIVAAVTELTCEYDVEAVGLGAAGFVDEHRSTVLFAPNIAWRGEPLRTCLQQRLGLPVVVENDANAAAWAEVRFGAARGEDQVVLLTVGTGIGGGIVLDGQVLRGRFGVAAEIGHLNMVPDGRHCGCGLRGCWEQYASGGALLLHAQELASRCPELAGNLLRLAGGRSQDITGQMVTDAARTGDAAALQAFAEIGTWLGRGLAELAAVLDPALFVIGGGVSAAGEVLRRPTEQHFRTLLTGAGHRPAARVRIAELGHAAGLIGAADLARVR